MKKNSPRLSASNPQPSPHSTGSGNSHAPRDITVVPVAVGVSASIAPVLTSVRGHMRGLRKISRLEEKKRAEKMRAVSESLEALDHEFQGRVRAAQQALAQNQVKPFLWVVSHFGPRGFARVLADPTALATVESWWIDLLQRVNSQGGKKLMDLVNMLTEGVSGKDKEYAPTELPERERQQGCERQRKYRERRQEKLKAFEQAVESIKKSSSSQEKKKKDIQSLTEQWLSSPNKAQQWAVRTYLDQRNAFRS